MKRTHIVMLSLITLIILIGIGATHDAAAEVRVGAVLGTPAMKIRIGTAPSCVRTGCVRVPPPMRSNVRFRIGVRDRRIARRLARYTGVPTRELLRIRRRGYRWMEIGRWLRLPRQVVRAAMSQRSWNRFLRRRLIRARRGGRLRRGYRLIMYDD